MASAHALNVRLIVEKTARPPGRTKAAHSRDELRWVGNVLDDLKAGDDIERAALRDEIFDPLRAIIDRQALRLGVAFRNCDIAFGWIDRRDVGAHPCERFGNEPAAAADVESASDL